MGNLESPINLYIHVFGPGVPNASTGRTCKLHTERPQAPARNRTQKLLTVRPANHHTSI